MAEIGIGRFSSAGKKAASSIGIEALCSSFARGDWRVEALPDPTFS
jgi:hypothetical protein